MHVCVCVCVCDTDLNPGDQVCLVAVLWQAAPPALLFEIAELHRPVSEIIVGAIVTLVAAVTAVAVVMIVIVAREKKT